MIFKKELKCQHRHTIKTHRKCFNEDGTLKVVTNNFPKILSLDIETLPILAYSWDVWDTNIYSERIVKDWCILSFSAKWLDDNKIISEVLTPKEAVFRDDERIVSTLWKLLERAEIVIGFNSKRFDIKKINARFLKYGLHKPSSYKHIDLIQTARSTFGLTYNKLDFIAEFLDLQRKLETDFDLWKMCDNGDKKALQTMREYNEMDVVVQESLYYKLREWIVFHPNLAVMSKMSDVCPVCLSKNYKEIGLYTANTKQYKEYRCSCGSIWHNVKSI